MLTKENLHSPEVLDARGVVISPSNPKKPMTAVGYQFAPTNLHSQPVPLLIAAAEDMQPVVEYRYSAAPIRGGYESRQINTPFHKLRYVLDTAVAIPEVRNNAARIDYRETHLTTEWGLLRPEAMAHGLNQKRRMWVMQESGLSGSAKFINPSVLLNLHQSVDRGVSIFYPIDANTCQRDVELVAEITATTNKFFAAHGYHEVMNVSQGYSLEDRFTYADIVGESGAGLYVAGLGDTHNNLQGFAGMLAEIIRNTKYNHYHVAGAATLPQMAIMAALAYRNEVLITSDSAAWIAGARSSSFIDSNLKSSTLNTKTMVYEPLMCSCVACRMVGQDSFAYTKDPALLSLHNLHMYDNAAKRINEMFQRKPMTSVEAFSSTTAENIDVRGLDALISGKSKIDTAKRLTPSASLKAGKLFGASSKRNSGTGVHVAYEYAAFFKNYSTDYSKGKAK